MDEITSILNDFYATIKQYTDKFRLIFITGVTRISHLSIFSAFNNFKDLSLRNKFNSLLGFTKDELQYYFDAYIEKASHILNMSKDEVYQRIEQYYDGFMFSLEAGETVYNPWSILNFLDSPEEGFCNYWFESGGNSSLIFNHLKINGNFDLLNYENREILRTKNELSCRFEITNIPFDVLLFQTGYLTLSKKNNNIACLVFPNTEVEDSMLNLYLTANNFRCIFSFNDHEEIIMQSIDQKNISSIVNIFNEILNDCVSILSNIFNDERSVRDIIYAALPQNINFQKIKERETAKGFPDLELITNKTHMVIEFKRTTKDRKEKASLEEAIKQLCLKKYGIGAFKGRILYRVAMVISTDKKMILCDYCKEVS